VINAIRAVPKPGQLLISVHAASLDSALDISASAWDVPLKSGLTYAALICPKRDNSYLSPNKAKSRKKMQITGAHVLAARGLLGLSKKELADLVGVAEKTILRFEKGDRVPNPATLQKIQEEMERRGIEFSNGTGTGVRLDHLKAAEFARKTGHTTQAAER